MTKLEKFLVANVVISLSIAAIQPLDGTLKKPCHHCVLSKHAGLDITALSHPICLNAAEVLPRACRRVP
jgi:hypothetical protein